MVLVTDKILLSKIKVFRNWPCKRGLKVDFIFTFAKRENLN